MKSVAVSVHFATDDDATHVISRVVAAIRDARIPYEIESIHSHTYAAGPTEPAGPADGRDDPAV